VGLEIDVIYPGPDAVNEQQPMCASPNGTEPKAERVSPCRSQPSLASNSRLAQSGSRRRPLPVHPLRRRSGGRNSGRNYSCEPVRVGAWFESRGGLYAAVEEASSREAGRRRSGRRFSECGRRSSVGWFAGRDQPTVRIPVEGDDLPSHGVGDKPIRDYCRLRACGPGAPGAR
jgi:hypothetical protein